jgi:Rieske 2Fe-2S family protein
LTEDGQFQPEAAQGLFPFNPGMKTISTDGDWVSRKPLGNPQSAQFSTGYITFPNFCGVSYYADYGTAIVIEPVSVDRTRMFCEWFVHQDAVEGVDYNLDRLIEAWDKTNAEDIILAERNFKGTQSMRFTPGPHVIRREAMVRTALVGYLDMMNAPDTASIAAANAPGSRAPASDHGTANA